MLEERGETEKPISGCRIVCLIAYIGLGILASPFILFIFVMAHDAPQRNSLQTGIEISYILGIALYLWGLVKLIGAGFDKQG
jgi:flagellar basal body-associated protein FliL